MSDDKVIFDFDDSQVKRKTLGEISDAVVEMALQKVQQSLRQTAIVVLAVVFFVGFSCGAVVINGICGGW